MRPVAVDLRKALLMLTHAVLVACGTAALLAGTARGGEPACEPDVWVVSPRCLGGTCCIPDEPRFGVERLGPGHCGRRTWQQATLAELVDDPSQPLAIFIHGNRYDPASAKQQGLAIAHRLARFSPTGVPARTVVFSWPSEKQGLLLTDGRTKYQRCYSDAHYLAALLTRIDPNQPVAIVGYSFGGLIVMEALDNLCDTTSDQLPCGAGSLLCRPGPLHLVLVAPAVRCDAFAPRGPYHEALACIDRLTLVINTRDDALRFFHLLDKRLDVPALGQVGMPSRWAAGETAFRMTDAASIIGRRHSLLKYLDSATLSAVIATGAVAGL